MYLLYLATKDDGCKQLHPVILVASLNIIQQLTNDQIKQFGGTLLEAMGSLWVSFRYSIYLQM